MKKITLQNILIIRLRQRKPAKVPGAKKTQTNGIVLYVKCLLNLFKMAAVLNSSICFKD